MAEVIPNRHPDTLGACDVAAAGVGGVHFVPTATGLQPVLWRSPFPTSTQKDVASFANPKGQVTNSNFELAGTLAHQDALAQHFDVSEHTNHTLSDNTPTVCWQQKGSTTAAGPPAHLLRLQSLRQWHHRCVSLFDHTPDEANGMADTCSRAWHLTDDQLLTHFNTLCPQEPPWQLCPRSSQCIQH